MFINTGCDSHPEAPEGEVRISGMLLRLGQILELFAGNAAPRPTVVAAEYRPLFHLGRDGQTPQNKAKREEIFS